MTDAAMVDDDRGKDDKGDKDGDDGDAEEGLPRFSACIGANDQEKLRRLDFLSAFQSYVHFMVTAISPNDGSAAPAHSCTVRASPGATARSRTKSHSLPLRGASACSLLTKPCTTTSEATPPAALATRTSKQSGRLPASATVVCSVALALPAKVRW